MGYFRRPKTQNERKGDQALLHNTDHVDVPIKGRARSIAKVEAAPPTERSDIVPSSRNDRSRGKPSHSPARKARDKRRGNIF
ncbi:hypothetical protein [Pelagibius sp. Alg239-R121]|uniref:hypothetical protein n=1 Tax=Pelagibius sp. Alg239-R121 TaxID=2993448 RepID=UPI0024A6BFD9|nr:hypothetical protein [Pelagibius sp. Alg239-R121]